jgi:hypothetical protein
MVELIWLLLKGYAYDQISNSQFIFSEFQKGSLLYGWLIQYNRKLTQGCEEC